MKETDVIILGSGPAGCTAAIYLTRSGFKPIVFGGQIPGGQLIQTHLIENFPGFPEPISGFDLMDRMIKQTKTLGAEVKNEEIAEVDFKTKPFKLTSTSGEKYTAKAVIIATGARARWLGLPSETKFRNRGVSTCATCDGFFFKGKDVCVVGGGDTAIGDALLLANFVNSVTIIHRSQNFRAFATVLENAKKHPKIKFVTDSVVEEVLGDEAVTGVKVKNTQTNQAQTIPCKGLFVAIGHNPCTFIFKDQLELDKSGYIVAHERCKTSIEGVFVSGDVCEPDYKQAIVAAGSGCIASLQAECYLRTCK
jgi:thioredoxin reductase (NADPH)